MYREFKFERATAGKRCPVCNAGCFEDPDQMETATLHAAVRFLFFGSASGTTVRSGERSNSFSLSGNLEKGTAREKSFWVSSRTSPSSFVNGLRLDIPSPNSVHSLPE